MEKKTKSAKKVAGGDDFVAIATVMHLLQSELRDKETPILTLNPERCSPWSAKVQYQNQYFNLRRR